jgi:hypothetical protein
MNGQNSSRLRLFQIFCLVFISIAFWLLRAECLNSELTGVSCLNAVTDPFKNIAAFGTYVLNFYPRYAQYEMEAAGAGVILILLTLAVRRQLSWWAFFYLLALTLTGWGELWALQRKKEFTLYCDIAAFSAAIIGFVCMLKRAPAALSEGWIDTERRPAKVTMLEVFTVIAILTVTCITRFHQLNRNPSGYDAEACPHRLIADTWGEILEQEVGGYVQQSSGMSWVALHKLFTRVEHSSLFYLDERLLATALSLLGCVVFFFFIRSVRGPFAAVMGLLLYSLGPLDIDWARLPVMHHVPVILAILIIWATLSALNARSWWSFAALALLIPCTKFVYPSAKLAAVGPLAALVGIVLFHRKEWRGHLRKFTFVLVGFAVFLLIRSVIYYFVHQRFLLVPPFENPYPASSSISQFERIKQMLQQGLYFFYEVFYAPASPTHWTNHATVLPTRSLSSITVVFMAVAFTRLAFLFKKPEALVFMAMIGCGLIPGMATELADRRIAVSLTLCIALGVLEISWLLDTVVGRASPVLNRSFKAVLPIAVFLGLGLIQSTAYFTRHTGRPMQMQAGDSVLAALKDDTLVIYLGDEGRCEMFFTVYTRMVESGGSIAYATANDGPRTADDQILKPEPVISSWYYTISELMPQIEKLKEKKKWGHYIFAFQPTESRKAWMDLIRKTYPNGKESTFDYNTAYGQKFFVYEVDNPPSTAQSADSSPLQPQPPKQ